MTNNKPHCRHHSAARTPFQPPLKHICALKFYTVPHRLRVSTSFSSSFLQSPSNEEHSSLKSIHRSIIWSCRASSLAVPREQWATGEGFVSVRRDDSRKSRSKTRIAFCKRKSVDCIRTGLAMMSCQHTNNTTQHQVLSAASLSRTITEAVGGTGAWRAGAREAGSTGL